MKKNKFQSEKGSYERDHVSVFILVRNSMILIMVDIWDVGYSVFSFSQCSATATLSLEDGVTQTTRWEEEQYGEEEAEAATAALNNWNMRSENNLDIDIENTWDYVNARGMMAVKTRGGKHAVR